LWREDSFQSLETAGASMQGKHCRLYDEQLVKNIIISAGLSVFDYINEKASVDEQDICEFLEVNADSIIADTIEELNDDISSEELPDEEPEPPLDQKT
jgi:hypothetical protein